MRKLFFIISIILSIAGCSDSGEKDLCNLSYTLIYGEWYKVDTISNDTYLIYKLFFNWTKKTLRFFKEK